MEVGPTDKTACNKTVYSMAGELEMIATIGHVKPCFGMQRYLSGPLACLAASILAIDMSKELHKWAPQTKPLATKPYIRWLEKLEMIATLGHVKPCFGMQRYLSGLWACLAASILAIDMSKELHT
jgi:hypothetical protein